MKLKNILMCLLLSLIVIAFTSCSTLRGISTNVTEIGACGLEFGRCALDNGVNIPEGILKDVVNDVKDLKDFSMDPNKEDK